jgi:hypothetical protein
MIDPVITFNQEAIKEILYWFDKSTDDEGYVIDMDKKRVVALDGGTIKIDEVGGIIGVDGVPKIFRNSVLALIEMRCILEKQKKKTPSGWDVVD